MLCQHFRFLCVLVMFERSENTCIKTSTRHSAKNEKKFNIFIDCDKQKFHDVCYNDFPVRLIGTHAGLSSGYGPTHNTIVEFSIMNALPNMTMVAPCDANQAKKLLRKSLDYKGPIYIRIPRGEEPAVYADDYEYDYEIGKAIVINEGKDVTIIATGMGVYHAVQAAMELEKHGIDAGVIDMHTIKPIDKEAIISAAKTTGNIITVEDHNVLGGLGSRVADVLMEENVPARLKKIGVPDCFAELGYPEELYPHYGIDTNGIVKTTLEFIKK